MLFQIKGDRFVPSIAETKVNHIFLIFYVKEVFMRITMINEQYYSVLNPSYTKIDLTFYYMTYNNRFLHDDLYCQIAKESSHITCHFHFNVKVRTYFSTIKFHIYNCIYRVNRCDFEQILL